MIDNISIVIPSFNESLNIDELYNRLVKTIIKNNIKNYEVIFVDNGSTDNSLELLTKLNKLDSSVKVISLSRNFGYQNAILAGLKYTSNDYVCVIDGDLQDPPEIISEFINKIKDGYDVVYGIRKKRDSTLLKKICYKIFYEIYTKFSEIDVPKQVGEFCLMKRKIVNIIISLKEKNIFLRGLRSWTGFKQTGVEFDRLKRNAGKAKFSFLSSFILAIDGIVSFSLVPLRAILITGIISTLILFFYFVLILSVKLFYEFGIISTDLLVMPKGLTITNLLIIFFMSLILLMLGIIGEYIGKIYFEVKKRPNYIIDKIIE